MSLKDDISSGVDDYFSGTYKVTKGRSVPSAEDVGLGKVGTSMELAMMFVDIRNQRRLLTD